MVRKGKDSPGEALRQVGAIFLDTATGKLVVQMGKIAHAKPVGRPKKTLRDVALTLHFEYLSGVEKLGKGKAYEQLAKQFSIGGESPDKSVRPIIKRTRVDVTQRFRTIAICEGPPSDARVMAYLGRHDDGTVEGFAVHWGSLNATYGRGAMTMNPGGVAGFDLDLDPEHPGLQLAK